MKLLPARRKWSSSKVSTKKLIMHNISIHIEINLWNQDPLAHMFVKISLGRYAKAVPDLTPRGTNNQAMGPTAIASNHLLNNTLSSNYICNRANKNAQTTNPQLQQRSKFFSLHFCSPCADLLNGFFLAELVLFLSLWLWRQGWRWRPFVHYCQRTILFDRGKTR